MKKSNVFNCTRQNLTFFHFGSPRQNLKYKRVYPPIDNTKHKVSKGLGVKGKIIISASISTYSEFRDMGNGNPLDGKMEIIGRHTDTQYFV